MSVLKRIFSRKPASGPLFSRRGQTCIVDAVGMVSQRHKIEGGQCSPRTNAVVLKDLAQFASREGLDMRVVFMGRELREAAEGRKHSGVFAYYGDNREQANKKIATLIKLARRKRPVVVLTADPSVEAVAKKLKVESMRLSTLKKAMDNKDDKQRAQQRKRNGRKEPARDAGQKAQQPNSRDSAVYNLIDPI